MAERPEVLDVGRIAKPHGLKGEVIVELTTDRDERLNAGTTLVTERGELVVQHSQPHQGRFVVRFDAISTREDAERWRGVVLRAQRIELDGTIWIDELFGATVEDEHGTVHGVVESVEENPASDILVLDTGYLVPLTFVVSVIANERIVVATPEGIFE